VNRSVVEANKLSFTLLEDLYIILYYDKVRFPMMNTVFCIGNVK